MKQSLLTLGLIAWAAGASAQVPTVTPIPMEQDNMPAVADFTYNPGDTVRVPTITWGGDVPTVHGNGDAVTTQAGSIFGRAGLDIELYREDNFRQQVRALMMGETPVIRGTVGMITAALPVLCEDDRTCPQVIYNLSRSAGGDSLVAASGINTIGDLRGRRVCLQADGPHMDLLSASLGSAGMSVSDVTVQWYQDLGFDGSASAAHAFQAGECDAAFVIFPDKLELVEGDGAVPGAKEIFSTANMDKVIYDVYAVRSDFAAAHPEWVGSFTNALLRANDSLRAIVQRGGEPSLDTHASRDADYRAAAAAGASLLFGVDGDVTFDHTVMEMYAFDLRMQRWTGNVNFMTPPAADVRGAIWLGSVTQDAQAAFTALGLSTAAEAITLASFPHDYEALQDGVTETFGVEAPRLNAAAVTEVVESLSVQELGDRTITDLVVYFEANQDTFSPELYGPQFEQILQAMSTSSGAVVAVTGHSGVVVYLSSKYGKGRGTGAHVEIAQSALNQSRARAEALVAALVAYGESGGYDVSFDGVVPIGLGITEPNGGLCSWSGTQDPCGPGGWHGQGPIPSGAEFTAFDTEERRATVRVINVASEQAVFADGDF